MNQPVGWPVGSVTHLFVWPPGSNHVQSYGNSCSSKSALIDLREEVLHFTTGGGGQWALEESIQRFQVGQSQSQWSFLGLRNLL